MTLAPVVIFAYNRLTHLQRCIKSLHDNLEFLDSPVFIFLDGPKDEVDKTKQISIKIYLESLNLNSRSKLIYRNKNYGLSNSVIIGLNEIFQDFDRVIIVEDDLEVSPYFLKFMNEALNYYQQLGDVGSIHGFSYELRVNMNANYFLRGGDCWGWGTWKDRWYLFEKDAGKLIPIFRNNPKLKKEFDLGGSYPFFKMLERQSLGLVDSWAIRWHASLFIANKLTLYPYKSLVKNLGFDGSGTHLSGNFKSNPELSIDPIVLDDIPVKESKLASRYLGEYLRVHYRIGFRYSYLRVIRKIFHLIRSLLAK